MANIFKAFMYDLRTDGFVYAVKSTVREFNPYAQLRDARAWMEDQRETIEALAQEVVQLEAQLEATKYVFVPGNDYPEHVTPRSWRYAYCPPPTPTLDEWMEGADLSVPAGEYEPTGSRFLFGNIGISKSSVVMLDEWPECDPDVLKDIRDKLNPLLVKRFEGMNTGEVYDALQQDAYEQAIMKLSDEEIAVLKTVWKVED